jgi:hypothetical protein
LLYAYACLWLLELLSNTIYEVILIINKLWV